MLSPIALNQHAVCWGCWAEARLKIARMTLTIKLDGNWSSFQLANSAPPLSVTDSAIAPSARMVRNELNSDLKICLSAQHEDQNLLAWQSHFVDFDLVTPKGVLSPGMCRPSTTREGLRASPRGHPPKKNNVTSKSSVGDISVVTLKRTDTTLDHSQQAEKVWTTLDTNKDSKPMLSAKHD